VNNAVYRHCHTVAGSATVRNPGPTLYNLLEISFISCTVLALCCCNSFNSSDATCSCRRKSWTTTWADSKSSLLAASSFSALALNCLFSVACAFKRSHSSTTLIWSSCSNAYFCSNYSILLVKLTSTSVRQSGAPGVVRIASNVCPTWASALCMHPLSVCSTASETDAPSLACSSRYKVRPRW
jgi:hypothetical protein